MPSDFRETAIAIFEGRLGALDWTHARALSEVQRHSKSYKMGLLPIKKYY